MVLLAIHTFAKASSNSCEMNSLRHGSRSGAVKWRLHLMMPQISQSMGFVFGSCFKPKYFCTFWKVCDILDLCCKATIIAAHPAANEKLMIKPKNILKEKKREHSVLLNSLCLWSFKLKMKVKSECYALTITWYEHWQYTKKAISQLIWTRQQHQNKTNSIIYSH